MRHAEAADRGRTSGQRHDGLLVLQRAFVPHCSDVCSTSRREANGISSSHIHHYLHASASLHCVHGNATDHHQPSPVFSLSSISGFEPAPNPRTPSLRT
ncbi:hypothetical protein PMAYCL1PPCAC_11010 [Pristionchus mayeri]|uniref:Uncharacterized protein n=1 Tax=Pristionchus mayeri TaxID=1317129 RepID=A0AAN4ZPK2_9BILA|nr:hypothetical protein PMAYCL1PPCAC_11010 [Pristionchus mayeri]